MIALPSLLARQAKGLRYRSRGRHARVRPRKAMGLEIVAPCKDAPTVPFPAIAKDGRMLPCLPSPPSCPSRESIRVNSRKTSVREKNDFAKRTQFSMQASINQKDTPSRNFPIKANQGSPRSPRYTWFHVGFSNLFRAPGRDMVRSRLAASFQSRSGEKNKKFYAPHTGN
jgi:hypothetical protein